MIGNAGIYTCIGMGKDDDGLIKPGPPDNFFHFKADGTHQFMAHMGLDVILVENPEAVDIVKIDQDMGTFGRGHLNAGYAEHIFIGVDFKGTLDGIVIGNGNADIQFLRSCGDRGYLVESVGMIGMKVHINNGIFLRQRFQIRPFKQDSVGLFWAHYVCFSNGVKELRRAATYPVIGTITLKLYLKIRVT